MTARRARPLYRYQYDPLDQLVGCATSAQTNIQRFYLKNHLATEVQGVVQRSIMQHGDQLLAERRCEGGTMATTFLATDRQRSVLTTLDATRPHVLAYTPYGHRIPENGLLSLLGFNGERTDLVTGHYLLGNGYRAFNPVLMRFNSPDSWSPFGEGGMNAYAYCAGEPVLGSDPTGHSNPFIKLLKGIGNKLELRTPKSATVKTPLAGNYKKINNNEITPSTSTPINNLKGHIQQEPPTIQLSNSATEEELLSVFIPQRQQTINTLLGRFNSSTALDEKHFLRAQIKLLDKQLLDAEKKLNTLDSLKSNPIKKNKSIRKNENNT
ncbi:RHS repeat-associated core domain-containing protein [Pseudomonas fluorescens]|uniref:RHS repeat-associated core domain-containing protein n=1 Tax=Pseudomonas fluorescens TaxID=294 RepID=UPI0012413676|nr:RHS repeat-associated core domain-containing protein [Pseudomonas fluorescens]VVM83852.1 hypothetical protein PS639_02413 [Pseudomonas fluorescens]